MMPIDLVIPMVFPADKNWLSDYARYHGNAAVAKKHVRFRSWGTENLLVECCMKYMPWVNRIHILLSSETQVQDWMRDMAAVAQQQTGQPSISLVFHKDFIPERFLPCFTSPCIEMFLHRIPGLAEQFIYSNDDFFPLSPLLPEDFFRTSPNGGKVLPCQRLYEKPFPAQPNIFQKKCINQQNMIAAPFGKRYTKTWLKNGHSMAPILRSSCEEVWKRHEGDIIKYLSPIKRTDHSFNHYIYVLYQHFTGQYVDHVPRQQYVGTNTPVSRIAEIIHDSQAGIVCLNDNERIMDWERRAAIVRRELRVKIFRR